jgi:putative PIN family toxin of toxin-antitoxin system
MIKACLDTNIFVSGFISPSGLPSEIIDAWRNREFILLTSNEIINEVSKVLNYPKIKKAYSLSDTEIEKYLTAISKYSQRMPGELKINVITEDPSDNMFIACAFEGKADFIISGDNHLLSVETYEGIRIITASEFVKQIKP